MKKFLFLILFAGLAIAEDDTQVWIQGIYQTPVSEKFNIYAEVQPRFDQGASRLQRILIRPAVNYALTPELSVWMGYLWMPTFFPSRNDEHRLWQQLVYVNKIDRFTVFNRFRLEERFLDPVVFRLRNLLRFQLNFTESDSWGAVIYDELFFNLTGSFDQNRLFLGINVKVAENVRIDLGYLNNLIFSATNRTNHVFLMTLFLS